jgi:hypothetical protein
MTSTAAHRRHRLLRLLATAAAAVAILTAPGARATAGNWAVASLDEVPSASAGETAPIGFTILQHGVTPVRVSGEVGIEIRHADGSVDVVPALPEGAPGHYVAAVTFPDSVGSYEWAVRMGPFGTHELDTLDVDPPGADGRWWTSRWSVLVGTALLAVIVVGEIAAGRRRRGAPSARPGRTAVGAADRPATT